MRTITIKAGRCGWLMFMNGCPVASDVPVPQPVQKAVRAGGQNVSRCCDRCPNRPGRRLPTPLPRMGPKHTNVSFDFHRKQRHDPQADQYF
jgi:hypothetical protein